MYRTRHVAGSGRRGVILVVVLSLLGLFAVVALSFVLYADAAASAARAARESEAPPGSNVEPELLLSYFLNQMIYDVPDTEPGVYSALRGHSLARTMFGWAEGTKNDQAFNGVGPVHYTHPASAGIFNGSDDYYLVNYTYFPSDGLLRDPERVGTRLLSQARWPYVGFNGPYTYPDRTNMFLARVDANGKVIEPSYHRANIFGSLDSSNANWTSAVGKYLTLRPRPQEHGSTFLLPEDTTGDVKNWASAPGGNDSIWIDLGFPVMTAPNGKKFKPLFAPLAIDLDNCLNLLAHGNIRGANATHQSHQGWGGWEVNLAKVLADSNTPPEWANLFAGRTSPTVDGRYGPDGKPTAANSVALSGTTPRFYAPVNFDGDAATVEMPGVGTNPAWATFPVYGTGYGNGNLAERTNHPLLYNPITRSLTSANAFTDDRHFPLSNMEALLRYGETGSPMLTSDLFRVLPTTLSSNALARRLITTRSFDRSVPGATPWLDTNAITTAAPYRYENLPAPTGAASNFPAVGGASPGGEFGGTWRGVYAALGRVDLNRLLPRYPVPDQTNMEGRQVINAPVARSAFDAAESARQRFAKDIWNVLVAATGANTAAAANTPEFNALRWLAQLAVNIVDYVDYDDYMTPFFWQTPNGRYDPNTPLLVEVVYGTEMPRVLINEIYVEAGNDPRSMTTVNGQPAANMYYKGNVWLELVNVFKNDVDSSSNFVDNTPERPGRAILEMPPTAQAAGDNYGVYQVVLASLDATGTTNLRTQLEQFANAAGDHGLTNTLPAPFADLQIVNQFTHSPGSSAAAVMGVDTRFLNPIGSFGGAERANNGFYLLGPKLDRDAASIENDPFPNINATQPYLTCERDEMSVNFPVAGLRTALTAGTRTVSVLLRRLACPNLPPNPVPGQPGHNPALAINPYITVDTALEVRGSFGAKRDEMGQQNQETPFADRRAYGRKQPYAGQTHLPQVPQTPYTDRPQHSFYQHNLFADTPVDGMGFNRPNPPYPGSSAAGLGAPPNYPEVYIDPNTNMPAARPFDWLVHLDRQLISPMEALHVSVYRPHELTARFSTGLGQSHNHALHNVLFSNDRRLYRAFEYLTTSDRFQVLSTSGLELRTAAPIAVPRDAMNNPLPAPWYATIPINGGTSGITPSGTRWAIKPGDTLIIDEDGPTANLTTDWQENVVVQAVSGNTVTAGPFFKMRDMANGNIRAANTRVRLAQIEHRLPGKININTVRNAEILLALAAASGSNNFSDADVQAAFNDLIRLRDGDTMLALPQRPFASLTTGNIPAGTQYPNGAGIADTILRPATDAQKKTLFHVRTNTGTATELKHPYQQYELLTKLFNHLTTRSNVFAVWVTVGFFEVTDTSSRPVKLGAEIGKAEGRNVRHRMFAIVDRSNVPMPLPIAASTAALTPLPPNPNPIPSRTMNVTFANNPMALPSPFTDMTWSWSIEPGTYIVVDPGTSNEEIVTVQSYAVTTGNQGTITAQFTKDHGAGVQIIIPGNPGPRSKFDLRGNKAVVPYFSIID